VPLRGLFIARRIAARGMSAFVVAFGGKADLAFCSAHVCF